MKSSFAHSIGTKRPRSMTLDDLELLKVQIFSEFCATSYFGRQQGLNDGIVAH